MHINWPLTIALLLILLKQLFKLFINHKPDTIDYLKALAVLPMDTAFLIVGLFVKAATHPKSDADQLVGLMVAYIVVSLCATALWRVCDAAVTNKLGWQFVWAFPLNAAISVTTFYLALQLVPVSP
jgi:hypothetical protein